VLVRKKHTMAATTNEWRKGDAELPRINTPQAEMGKPTEIDPGQEEGRWPIRLFARLIACVDTERYPKLPRIATNLRGRSVQFGIA
jgi:hypothetical protein